MKLLENHSGNHPSNSGVTMEKHNRNNGFGEKGSALLLTLGILSLVMLMAMSFAFSSRTTRHVAKVNADLTAASLHSETGVDRAVGLMYYMLDKLDAIGNTINDPTLSLYPARRNLATTLGDAEGVNPVEAALYGERFNFSAHKFTYQPGGSGNPYVTQHMWGYTNEAGNDGTPEEDRRSFYNTLIQEVPGFEDMYIYRCVDTNSAGDWPAFEGSDRGTEDDARNYLQKIDFHTIWSGDEVVGRLGYLVLEEGHKFDINQLLTLRKRESGGDLPFVQSDGIVLAGLDEEWSLANNDYYFNITGDYNPQSSLTSEASTKRLGVHVQELNVGNAYYDRLLDGIDAKIGWQSYDHLWKGMIPGDVPNSYADIVNDSVYKEDHALFTFFSAEEPESWRYTDDDAEYARFDITGYEWRPDKGATATSKYYGAGNKPSGATDASGWSKTCTGVDKDKMVKTLAFVQALGAPKPDTDIPAFSADPADASECIPALAYMVEDADDPSGSGKRSVARQVAANMIDYCDGDNHATLEDGYYRDLVTDPVPMDEVKPPKYCGNEKVAYFNELGLQFAITRTFKSPNSFDHLVTLKPKVELCNIFNEDVPKGNVNVRIFGTRTIAVGTGAPGEQDNFDSRFEISQSGTIAGNTVYFDGVEGVFQNILAFNEEGIQVPSSVPGVFDYVAPEVNVVLRLEKIVLAMEGENMDEAYDIGYWQADECEESKQKFVMRINFPGYTDPLLPGTVSDVYYYASLEANDPRCNHRTIGWKWRKRDNEADDGFHPDNDNNGGDFTRKSGEATIPPTAGDEDAYHLFSTLGAKNRAFMIPDSGVDVEKNATDVNEISTNFIRNAPFETMWELGAIHRGEPFRTINLSMYTDPDSSDFDGSYEKGDAHILDQVKIGPLKYSRGRFNINSGNKDALDFMVDGLFGEDDTYDNYSAWPEGSDLGLPIWKTDLTPGFHRGRFANMIAGTTYDDYDNDRQMESIIGRTANLLTTRNEAYSVIVVSQALKDLFLELDTDAREARFIELKDTFINPTIYEAYKAGAKETHYCDILGTNVTMANLVRDGWTGKIRVVKKVKLNKD